MLAPLARRVCLAFPIAGRRGRALPRDRPARRAARRRSCRRRASGFGIDPWEQLRARLRRLARRALDQRGGARGLDGSELPRAARDRRARLADARRRAAARPATTCASTSTGEASARRSRHAISSWPAPAARSSRSPPTVAPSILVPYPDASADHQRTNATWMERAGAAVVLDDGECSGPRLAAEVGRLIGDPRAARRDGARGAGAGPPGRRGRGRDDRAGGGIGGPSGNVRSETKLVAGAAISGRTLLGGPLGGRARKTARRDRRTVGGAAAALRRRRRRRHERLRARRPCARRERERARTGAASAFAAALAADGVLEAQIGHRAENVPPRARTSSWSARARSRPATRSASPRSRAACPCCPRASCWPS